MPATILFAEDDELVRAIATEALRGAGYKVKVVTDGREALVALQTTRPDLILTDVRMPNCTGFELLQHVRKMPEFNLTPVIIMSARTESADQRMGMSLGADDYVTKPFDPTDLLKTIEIRLSRASVMSGIIGQQQRVLTRVLPHELRAPLTEVMGCAEMLLQVGKTGEVPGVTELVEHGRSLRRSAQRLARLVEDLTLWADLESGRVTVQSGRATPARPTIYRDAEIEEVLRRCAADLGRESDLRMSVDVRMMEVGSAGLLQVLAHVVENGFKYSLPGTPVVVAINALFTHYRVVVVDHGRGMTDEEIGQAGWVRQFRREEFAQQGLGIGLALTHTFAGLVGGEFTLVRNPDGVGLSARLMVPRVTVCAESGDSA